MIPLCSIRLLVVYSIPHLHHYLVWTCLPSIHSISTIVLMMFPRSTTGLRYHHHLVIPFPSPLPVCYTLPSTDTTTVTIPHSTLHWLFYHVHIPSFRCHCFIQRHYHTFVTWYTISVATIFYLRLPLFVLFPFYSRFILYILHSTWRTLWSSIPHIYTYLRSFDRLPLPIRPHLLFEKKDFEYLRRSVISVWNFAFFVDYHHWSTIPFIHYKPPPLLHFCYRPTTPVPTPLPRSTSSCSHTLRFFTLPAWAVPTSSDTSASVPLIRPRLPFILQVYPVRFGYYRLHLRLILLIACFTCIHRYRTPVPIHSFWYDT